MKTIKMIPVLITSFIFTAHAQEKVDVKRMLADAQTQEAIFQSILNDNSLTAKFMDMMMQRAALDSMVCRHMCTSMMSDEHMANAIADRVVELQAKKDAATLEERKKRHETTHKTIPGKN